MYNVQQLKLKFLITTQINKLNAIGIQTLYYLLI